MSRTRPDSKILYNSIRLQATPSPTIIGFVRRMWATPTISGMSTTTATSTTTTTLTTGTGCALDFRNTVAMNKSEDGLLRRAYYGKEPITFYRNCL